MSVEIFIDTNVFIYNIDDTDQRKNHIASSIIRGALSATGGSRFCISHQVIQECLSAALRKATIPMDHATARDYLRTVLIPLWRVYPSAAFYQRGLDLQQRYRFSFYDSLIIAAAQEAGCNTLYSEDLQHAQVIGGLRIENPFLSPTH